MDQEFMNTFFDKQLLKQVNKKTIKNPIQDYPQILANFVKEVYITFNNSIKLNTSLYLYILQHCLHSELQLQGQPSHFFLQKIKSQANYVITFTQITVRIILLAVLCKNGEQDKKKQWKKNIKKFFFQTQLTLSFSSEHSLAQNLIQFLTLLTETFKEFTFYQKILSLTEKYDLSYTSNWVKEKIRQLKQKWQKQQIEKKKNWTSVKKVQKQRTKKRQDVKQQTPKVQQKQNRQEVDENSAKLRIKQFYTSNKKRKSLKPTPRVIYQTRRSFIKKQLEQEQEEIQYYDPEVVKEIKAQKPNMKKVKRRQQQVTDDDVLVPKTP